MNATAISHSSQRVLLTLLPCDEPSTRKRARARHYDISLAQNPLFLAKLDNVSHDSAPTNSICLFIWVSPFQFQAGLAGETTLCTYFMLMLLRQDGSLGSIFRLDSQAAPAYARSNLTFGPIA